jgi:hypothetical protein
VAHLYKWKEDNFCQSISDTSRCYGEHVGEHIGNLGNILGTHWELKENIVGTHWDPGKNEPLNTSSPHSTPLQYHPWWMRVDQCKSYWILKILVKNKFKKIKNKSFRNNIGGANSWYCWKVLWWVGRWFLKIWTKVGKILNFESFSSLNFKFNFNFKITFSQLGRYCNRPIHTWASGVGNNSKSIYQNKIMINVKCTWGFEVANCCWGHKVRNKAVNGLTQDAVFTSPWGLMI